MRALAVVAITGLLLAACGSAAPSSPAAPGVVHAVGAENQYANVIAQIGGRYVQVAAVESNPNTDPHNFEASPAVAQELAAAQLVVMNGLGYDNWAPNMLAASPARGRLVIDVQTLLALPDSTPNPHLWYDPATMPAVAGQVAVDLASLQPGHAA